MGATPFREATESVEPSLAKARDPRPERLQLKALSSGKGPLRARQVTNYYMIGFLCIKNERNAENQPEFAQGAREIALSTSRRATVAALS